MIFEQFGVESWMDRYEENARYNITDTCARPMTLEELFRLTGEDPELFWNRFLQREQTYGTIRGSEELRSAIAGMYRTVDKDGILPQHGATGANQHIIYSLVRPGDRVIAFSPSYQQFYSAPRAVGAQVTVLKLRKENRYLPDLDELREAARYGVRLIAMNNPNNPTGSVIPDEMMKEIADIAGTYGAYILCDEVYNGVSADGIRPASSIADLYEKGIATGSMSKAFSLAGLRLGWIATRNKAALSQFCLVRDYDIVSCSLFDEAAAALALRHREKILERNQRILENNLEILDNWVQGEKQADYIRPQAGTMALVYYHLDISSEDFCRRMYYETGAFAVPGDCFDEPHSFRVGYGHDPELLKTGLEAVSAFFRKLEAEGVQEI